MTAPKPEKWYHDLKSSKTPDQPNTTMGTSREEQMVVLERNKDGVPTIWCDPEVADLVHALNKGGVPTKASCSGHGEVNGNIALTDGRELLIARNFDEARSFEQRLNNKEQNKRRDGDAA